MADRLFHVYDIPSVNTDGERYDKEYKRAPKWDPDIGDFVRDGSNRIVEADGQENYQVWCLKILQTERFACLSYEDEIGVEMENALADDDHDTVESMMKRTITEALMANPRTIAVTGFSFAWNGDTVRGTCIVRAQEMDDFTVRF